jgi:hypothetical protein
MSLRKKLEAWQVRWAERNGIRVGPPPGNFTSRAVGYVSELRNNLSEPLSDRVRRQLIAGAGGEVGPDGQKRQHVEDAICHRREVDSFGAVLRSDGIPFVATTYQEVFKSLPRGNVTYLLERYRLDHVTSLGP